MGLEVVYWLLYAFLIISSRVVWLFYWVSFRFLLWFVLLKCAWAVLGVWF